MQLLNTNQILDISGGRVLLGIPSANWATLFGLSSKAYFDKKFNVASNASPEHALAMSALGLLVGFGTFFALEALVLGK